MHDTLAQVSGALEKPEDAGKGEAGEVKRWLMELDLSDKVERPWRGKAKDALKRYRDDDGGRKTFQFNILWSNTEVLRPNLYNSTPKADVRRRFRDEDPVGKYAALVMERALDYSIDTQDFDGVMNEIILDYLLPSRAVARVRFEPSFTEKQDPDSKPYQSLSYARCTVERVPWDRFRRGPGITWQEVTWIAYEHQLTRQEIEDKFGKEFADLVQWDVVMDGISEEKAAEEPTVFKRVRVWEIWDRLKRQILFLAPSCKDRFLKREDDKLNLEGFFDCERPLYAIESGNTLVPQVEYEMYRDQARELDRVTLRINRIVNTLKLRGIYDAVIPEMKSVMKAEDGDMIPTSTSGPAMQAGGLDKAVWMMPIAEAAAVLKELLLHREGLKQTIYELTGISDVLRGSTDPNETLGAQQLKAQSGSMRLQRRQRDVQRFIRGILRKKAEIIAENYTPELLALMTGVKLPTGEQKQQAQQQLAMMQQQAAMNQAQGVQTPPAPAPDPELQQAASLPSWDEVMQVLKSDLLRSFRIDIETDSTIAADQASEREQVVELMTGIGTFASSVQPLIESGAMSMEAAKKIMLASLRRFRLGRDVEDAVEQDAAKPAPQKPDPKMAEMQMKAKMAEQDLALKQADMQARMQMDGQKLAFEKEKGAAELQLKREEMMMNAGMKREQMAMEGQMKQAQMTADHQLKRESETMKHHTALEAEKIRGEATSKPSAVMQFDAKDEIKQVAEHMKGQADTQQQALGAIVTAAQALVGAAEAQQRMNAEQAAASTQVMQQSAEATQQLASAMQNLATVMGAETEAVRDASGRLIGSRRKALNG